MKIETTTVAGGKTLKASQELPVTKDGTVPVHILHSAACQAVANALNAVQNVPDLPLESVSIQVIR